MSEHVSHSGTRDLRSVGRTALETLSPDQHAGDHRARVDLSASEDGQYDEEEERRKGLTPITCVLVSPADA